MWSYKKRAMLGLVGAADGAGGVVMMVGRTVLLPSCSPVAAETSVGTGVWDSVAG